jgi:hypothetical protein
MAEQPQWVKFIVRLTATERAQLQQLADAGKRAGSVLKRAWVLLQADADGPRGGDPESAAAYGVCLPTVHRIRQAFVERGLDAALYRKQPTGRRHRKPDGPQEAHLLALACSRPPAGRKGWTLRLLADRLVELEVVDAISHECVRTTLKKTSPSRT